MNEKIQKPKYTKRRNSDFTYDILKDGHTMFSDDIIKELKRKSFLEKELCKQEPVENKDGEILAFEKLEDVELLLLYSLGVELNDSFKRGFKLARMSKKGFEAIWQE